MHERFCILFMLSCCFLFHSMHVIIYKKDIFDKALASLCVQNTHRHALCIVHYHIYAFLNLPSTALNIFLLYSDIFLLVFEQFIIHKENPYSTQIPVWHKCYVIFLPQRAHYTSQYTHYSKLQWHSTHPSFILCNHHRFFAQKNQCSMCTGFISRWVTVGNLQLLCSQPKLASSNIAHTVEKWDKNLLITKLIRYNLVCICHVAWFAN